MSPELVSYYQNVLGIRGFIAPHRAGNQSFEAGHLAQDTPVDAKPTSFRVVFLDSQAWSPIARELFEKMKEALGLKSEQFEVLFQNECSELDLRAKIMTSSALVLFSEQLSRSYQADRTFVIESPEILWQKPDGKRAAWQELKKLIPLIPRTSP